MIVPLRIRHSIVIALPLCIAGIGLGVYWHQSSFPSLAPLPSIVQLEEFGPMQEYHLHWMECTGHTLFVKNPKGKDMAIDFDEINSNKSALGALRGLGWEVRYPNGENITIIGRMSKNTHPSKSDQVIHMYTPTYDFQIQHWYITKTPFTYLIQKPNDPMETTTHQKSHLDRSDFNSHNFTHGIVFNPNAPLFNPHLYEKSRPK
jgi:hypothetical protein